MTPGNGITTIYFLPTGYMMYCSEINKTSQTFKSCMLIDSRKKKAHILIDRNQVIVARALGKYAV